MNKLTVALTLLVVLASQPAATVGSASKGVLRGYAAHYRVGAMERASKVHGLPLVQCMVASSYFTLGTWLVVDSEVTGARARCRVSDTTQRRHIALVRSRGIVIEFGAANIRTMCGLKRVGQEPPRKCPVVVTPA